MTSKEASTGSIGDDDDISVTSTVGSEPRSEYEVEAILAQKSFANGDAYLVKWAGYPLERATWEPEESFCDPSTLVEWRKKIAPGEHQPLDVDVEALARRIEEIENAKLDRQRRRRAKRIRLGLAVSPSTESSGAAYDSRDSDSDLDGFIVGDDVDVEGENEEEGWQSLRKKPRRSSNSKTKHGAAMAAPPSLSHSDPSKSQASASIRPPSAEFTNKKNKCDATSAARAPATNLQSTQSTQSTKLISPTKQVQTPKKLQKASERHEARPILKLKTSSSTHPSSHSWLSPAQGQAPSCSSPRESVNDQSQVPGPLIPTGLANRSVSIRATKKTGSNPTFFRNLSSKNRYEKAMRRDLTPDIMQLELRPPGEWIASQNSTTQVSESPSDFRISPNSESLFVEQDQPHHEANNRRHSHDSPTRIDVSTEARSGYRSNQAQHASGQPSQKLSHEGSLNSYNSETSIIRSPAFSPRETSPLRPSRHATPRGIQGTGGRFRLFQPTEALAHLRFGPESKEIGDVRLGGLTKTSIWQLVLLKSQNMIDIHFKDVCNLDQYRQLCDRRQNKKYCNGYVLGYDDTSTAVNELADYLSDNRLAALWYHPKDDIPTVIVAYASDCPDWSFLNGSDAYPPARLRIAVRSGLAPVNSLRPVSAKGTLYHAGEHSAGGEENHFNMNPQPIESMAQQHGIQSSLSKILSAANGPMDIVSIFRERFGITYDELSIVNTSRTARSFYLYFPREVEDEFQLVLLFLKHYDMVSFSNRIEGDWERFVKTVTTGTVLFHQKFIHYENLQMLSKLLRSHVNVFSISLAEPIKYLGYYSHLQRLFPHGGIILMTEDFMLKAPKAALKVLTWFGVYVGRKFPGTWKMFLRPNVQRWLSDICVSWPDDTLWQMYLTINSLIPEYPVGHYNTYRREGSPDSLDGLRDDEGQHHPFISTRDIPDYGSRREEDYPNIPKGLTQEERDADHLIEYFAGYALINADRFRRFVVLTTQKPQPRWQAWTHIEVMHYPDFKRKFMTSSTQVSASISSGGKDRGRDRDRNRDRDRDNKGEKVSPTKCT
ncbi:chromo domain-containing protein Chp1p [Blastomyces gilchristii SLH14081]|uniref:Chromo domain-containing protein Chp1p n=1 Tax=Blastomyces gilchristii (strain SLH14081) TaxID=559298 RepID=A0A179UQA0_BLAGS|nr:chromo domain-containing protein Chp1p [Blastomyces gilchristii SLH14081]OAT10184.1 chromo domain-containing protein Chp1p [Blastomyces gilchristii SLH14081]